MPIPQLQKLGLIAAGAATSFFLASSPVDARRPQARTSSNGSNTQQLRTPPPHSKPCEARLDLDNSVISRPLGSALNSSECNGRLNTDKHKRDLRNTICGEFGLPNGSIEGTNFGGDRQQSNSRHVVSCTTPR